MAKQNKDTYYFYWYIFNGKLCYASFDSDVVEPKNILQKFPLSEKEWKFSTLGDLAERYPCTVSGVVDASDKKTIL